MTVLRSRLLRLFRPWSHDSMLYEVTPRCNLKCPHCYNVWKDGVDYSEKELPTDRAIELVLRIIKDTRCRRFTFTGGEPLLRDDLELLVKPAAERCRHITLITNGTLLPEDRVRSLISAGVSMFELPLNAADRELHTRMTGGIECMNKVTRAAADIRYHGADVAFVFVGTSFNIGQWRKVLELGIALGARGFLYNRYNAGGAAHTAPDSLMPTIEDIRDGLEIAEEYASKYGVGIGASIAIPPCLIDTSTFPHVGFGFCAAGTSRAYYTVDPMGNVRPCNHTPTIIGNIFSESLRKMTTSPNLKTFLKARPPFCGGCRLESECQGGCKAAAEACYGSLTACEPFLELNKQRAVKPRT